MTEDLERFAPEASGDTPAASALCVACWGSIPSLSAEACPSCGASAPAEGWPEMPYAFRERYLLRERVERGATAALFQADAREGGQSSRVLVKVARTDGGPEAAASARKLLLREARTAGQLADEHACFVGVRGTDAADPAHIVYEHVDWPTLAERLLEPSTPDDVARIGIALLRAFEILQSERVVHGNPSPENIFVQSRDDGQYDVRILGAGAAPPGAVETTDTSDTSSARFYRSPEQRRGQAPTASSDLYAIGALLWHFASGDPPPTPLERDEVPPAMPEDLHAILSDMLRPEPADRGHAFSEARAALERFLAERPERSAGVAGRVESLSATLRELRERLEPYDILTTRAGAIGETLREIGEDPESPDVEERVLAVQSALDRLGGDVDALFAQHHGSPHGEPHDHASHEEPRPAPSVPPISWRPPGHEGSGAGKTARMIAIGVIGLVLGFVLARMLDRDAPPAKTAASATATAPARPFPTPTPTLTATSTAPAPTPTASATGPASAAAPAAAPRPATSAPSPAATTVRAPKPTRAPRPARTDEDEPAPSPPPAEPGPYE